MTRPLVIQVRKEVRALLPWWLAVAGATTAVAVIAQRQAGFPNFRHDLELWVAVVYGLGVLAVAALSVGHELTHGTMPALLVLPIGRLRVLSTKLLVLIPAVVALGVVADWLFVNRYVPSSAAVRPLLVWGPVMAAIGLVPLLTLLTRKPLGGVVFSIAIPGLVLVGAGRLYPLREGSQALSVTWYGTLILSALGVIGLFYRFLRLEAAGDRGSAVSARVAGPANTSVESTRATPRNWVWLQVKKELRLQQLTLAVSGLYVVACALVVVAQRLDPFYVGPTFYALSALHGVFIALLAGSIASAEERHLGTLTSHVLMPQAAWRQWSVKVGVTLGLVAALAIGLPVLLMLFHRPTDAFKVQEAFAAWILLIACAAVYVSSLSANSLGALLATFPALGVAFVVAGGIVDPMLRAFRTWFPIDYRQLSAALRAEYGADFFVANRARWDAIRSIERIVPIILAVGLGLLVLFFAARNHRSLERNARTVANQFAAFILYAVGATLTFFAITRIAREMIR